MDKFDAIVVGAGSGLNISSSLSQRGLSVALVEKGPMGGTCLNRGCIPSKIIIHSADLMESIERAGDFGIKLQGKPKVDFASITKRASQIVDKDAVMIEKGVKENFNISLFKTEGRFVSERTMLVGSKKITGDKVFILGGARPSILPIEGLEGSGYITSTDALRLTKQPKSMIVIGGGYIAAELVHFYGTLGTKVTVIQRSGIMLRREDHEIAGKFTELFSKRHNIMTGYLTDSVEKINGKFIVHVSKKEGSGKEKIEAEQLLVATGVTPNSDILDVEKAGIKTDKRGYIQTNEYLETSARNVWAAGDIAGKYLFKHSANLEAEYALYNAMNPSKKKKVDYTAMPHAIFSSPQIAGVGETEEQLKAKGTDYVVGKYYYKNTGMGEAIQEKDGFVKILADRKSRRILGCHILGPEAATLIHEVLVAMKYADAKVEAIANTIHIHPALPEVVERAAGMIDF